MLTDAVGVGGRLRGGLVVRQELGCAAEDLVRECQRGEGQRNTFQDGAALLLRGFDGLPVGLYGGEVLVRLVAEDVGVAADQLLDDVAGDVVDREAFIRVLLGDPGVEGDLAT